MAEYQKKFQDKVAVVTGASSGIGAATAIELAKLGCSLVLVGRQKVKLEETLAKCLATGLEKEKLALIIADLSAESEAKNVVDKAIQQFKKLDILVNSAGILNTGSIETMTLAQYDELMNINLRSVIVLTQEAIPYLINSKGNIVNVSSVTGLRAFPNVLSYCISKAALDQFTRCVSLGFPFQAMMSEGTAHSSTLQPTISQYLSSITLHHYEAVTPWTFLMFIGLFALYNFIPSYVLSFSLIKDCTSTI